MITPGRIGSAGTNWEQGYAFATGKRIIVIQYTNHPTSLMTYCGCNTFINTSKQNLFNDILTALDGDDVIGKCSTTLT